MASIAEIVDAPVDWIGALDSHLRFGLRRMAEDNPECLPAGMATILLHPDLLAPPQLPPWEQELLDMHASGLTYEHIARRLNILPEDVESDLKWIQHNLDVVGLRVYLEAERLAELTGLRSQAGVLRRPTRRPRPEDVEAGKKLQIGAAFLNELHDLLCVGERYQEERANLIKEYKAGQSTFVASIAVVLAPYLGAGVQLVAAAVAVALSVIGQVGLKAWCATQPQRRRQVNAPS
jgi:hypothetical protein